MSTLTEDGVKIGPEASDHGAAIEAVWRIESARLIAGLARMTGDIGLAEDLARDALGAAIEPFIAAQPLGYDTRWP